VKAPRRRKRLVWVPVKVPKGGEIIAVAAIDRFKNRIAVEVLG
jgi:hypothetical protein